MYFGEHLIKLNFTILNEFFKVTRIKMCHFKVVSD